MSELPEDKYSNENSQYDDDDEEFDVNEVIQKQDFEGVGEGEGLDDFDPDNLFDKREFKDVGEGESKYFDEEDLKGGKQKQKRKTNKRRCRHTKHKRCKRKKYKTKKKKNKRKSRRK